MSGVCVLAQDINQCPNYNADIGGCATNNKVCGFFRELVEKKDVKAECKRKPRWYEQYYNR